MKGILSVKEYRYMWHITIIIRNATPSPNMSLCPEYDQINNLRIYYYIHAD